MSNFKLAYTPTAFKDKKWFEKHDKIIFGKIEIFDQMLRETGKILIGKPETIVDKNYGKCVSVRIDKKNRYVYSYRYEPNGTIVVIACKGHYDDR